MTRTNQITTPQTVRAYLFEGVRIPVFSDLSYVGYSDGDFVVYAASTGPSTTRTDSNVSTSPTRTNNNSYTSPTWTNNTALTDNGTVWQP